MADKKKPKRLLGTTRDSNGSQSYHRPGQKGTKRQLADKAHDVYDKTNPMQRKMNAERAKVWTGVLDAAYTTSTNKKLARDRANYGAKSRVGKNRGGK
jgi:hypothetical protein